MDNLSKRVNTFKNWALSTHVWPYQLSNAGFFYTGDGTNIQCALCGVITSVESWERTDRPEIVHYCLNNECKFLKSNFPNLKETLEKEILLHNLRSTNDIQQRYIEVKSESCANELSPTLSNGITEMKQGLTIHSSQNVQVDKSIMENQETTLIIAANVTNKSRTHLTFYPPTNYTETTHPYIKNPIANVEDYFSKIPSQIGNRQVEVEVRQHPLTNCPIVQTRNTVDGQNLLNESGTEEE